MVYESTSGTTKRADLIPNDYMAQRIQGHRTTQLLDQGTRVTGITGGEVLTFTGINSSQVLGEKYLKLLVAMYVKLKPKHLFPSGGTPGPGSICSYIVELLKNLDPSSPAGS